MQVKKYFRFLMLFFFLILAAMVPFPMHFQRKDRLPTHTIEQVDKTKDDDEEDGYQAFS